ncbi:cytochrome c biogenesis CcdA family protein [Granulicoccus sp. GXG6511]|uniref:cytochrome c biogenesis CcdA family protein n=1 Tax=Granulicoccus sp. GXG6511 TaxID=3381351 RepID=UPI003D7CD6C9
MDIGLVSAFLGGVLALLSPCAALLLPAFFASTIGSGPRLLLHGAVFYVGMLVLLLPLGVAAGVVGSLFLQHRQGIVIVASLVLIVLGIAQLFGAGFDVSRALPGVSGLQSRAGAATGLAKTFLLGIASGVAGFCAGPILGAVLTLAASRGNPITAAGLLAVYGAGMVAPLLGIAALWRTLGDRGRRALRGRSVTVLGRDFHTTSLVTGLLMIGVGILFWTTNGLVGAPELIPADTQAWLTQQAARASGPVVEVTVILLVAVALLVGWGLRRRRAADRLR